MTNLKKVLVASLVIAIAIPAVAFATDYYSMRTVDENGRDIEPIVSTLNSSIAAKMTTPAGTTGQYIRGDGTLATMPVAAFTFDNAPSRSIVTTAAAANGFQLSSTRNASVYYSVNIATTATIGGASDGYIALEIAATNSTTASDWKEVSRSRNGQTITLAIALQSAQNITAELMNIVPAGYYARLRSVNTSGTPTYTFVSGQEVQL